MREPEPMLTGEERAFLAAARRAVLATVRPGGMLPRLVPICFVLAPDDAEDGRAVLYSPIDEKPKRTTDPLSLARVRDILDNPDVEMLVDRWSEDWAALGWLRLDGTAMLLWHGPAEGEAPTDMEAERRSAIDRLRVKYGQYAHHDLEARPLLRIAVQRVTRWGNLSGAGGPSGAVPGPDDP